MAVGAQQEVALSSRAPRFYWAPRPDRAPVEVTAGGSAALRRVVSLQVSQPTIGTLLASIERQTGLRFGFSRDVVPTERVITLHADSITVGAALLSILMDTGVDVVLSPDGKVALVQRVTIAPRQPPGNVRGRVTDAKTGEGISGVDVLLAGTRWRTSTDSGGRYGLIDVDSGTYTLMTRRVGYRKQTRRITVSAGEIDTVDVALEAVAVPLDELVTTATGPQRRRDLGNAITTIKADSVLRSAPIRNLTDLLANRVPGLTVQHTSGAPGDPARLRLRGISSVMRGNDPVVIVDGIRIDATQSAARSGNLTNLLSGSAVPAPSPLDQIDPNIIEKIEVFKGPSAATLYGADAANGVIVITTKKGKPGPTRWDARLELGRTTPAGEYPTGYYAWGHIRTTGYSGFQLCTLTNRQCVLDSLVKYQALNDPEMTILGRGHRNALTLTASGGTQALTYSVTGTYSGETGLLKLPEFEVNRFQAKFNREPPDWMRRPWELTTWSVTNSVAARLGPTADVTLSTTLSRSEQQRTQLENQQAAMANVYVDKVLGDYLRPTDLNLSYPFMSRQLGQVLTDYYRRTTASSITFTTGLNATWRPRPWFNASGHAGLNVIPRDDEQLLPSGLISSADSGQLIRGTGRSLVSTFDLQGTVQRPLRWGFVFQTSIGANLVTNTANDLVASGYRLIPGTSSLSGAQSFTGTDSRVSTSVFGWYIEPRVSGRRLSLSTGLRLDGGSAYGTRLTGFGSGPGRGLLRGLLALPKLNGSWVISEEPWFPFQSLFSSLQLRTAYGQAQQQPNPTDRLRLYTRRTGGSGDLLELDRLGNTELRPERSTEFEGGFAADMLDSRLSVELAAYRKLQVDALMPVALPNSVDGGGTIIRNIGNIRNTGVDVVTRVTPIQSSLLTWSAELTYNRNNNTLTKLGNGVEANPRQGIVAGYPVGGRFARPILGYADVNGDGVIQTGEVQVGDSLVFIGRLLPAYRASLFSNLQLFGGAVGVVAGFSYDAGQTQIDESAKANWTLNRAFVDPTTPLDQQAAAVVTDSTDYGVTQDVSTFRFNSFSVTYHAPPRIARLLQAQQLSFSLQGDNLGLHTTYRGKDPDVSAWSPGEHIVDTGQIARSRTWQLAVSLNF